MECREKTNKLPKPFHTIFNSINKKPLVYRYEICPTYGHLSRCNVILTSALDVTFSENNVTKKRRNFRCEILISYYKTPDNSHV
jgi:hypothetical protein